MKSVGSPKNLAAWFSNSHHLVNDPYRTGFFFDGLIFFIEFKAPGKKPSRAQAAMFQKMRSFGANVYIIDNIEQGKELILTIRNNKHAALLPE
ncbi:MAG: VRR-NUC domain-containing protein [Shewanella sp.]|nr:VRR-NUC domain-containing protein [Shewanella sp.]